MIDNTGKNEDQKIEYDENLYVAVQDLRKKFYTYKELCVTLEQCTFTGNQKKRQIKEFERYMCLEYNSKTKKYKIKEKYAVPLPPYPEEPSNAIYSKHVKTLLLNYLLRRQEKGGVIYVNSEKLYKALGMINDRYIEYKKDNKKKLKDELTAELVLNKGHELEKLHEETLKYYMDDFYYRSGSKLSTILKSALDTLQNQSYLTYSRAYMIYKHNELPAPSTDAEIEDIMDIERTVMDEFDFKDEKDIWFKGQKHEYWKRVLELVQDIYPDVYGLYRCHKIIGSKKNLQKALSREEESREMCELNQKILNFIDGQIEKNVRKSLKDNPYDYTKQLSDRYVDAQKYLSNRLIKIKERGKLLPVTGCIPEHLDNLPDLPEFLNFQGLVQDDDPDWFKEEI